MRNKCYIIISSIEHPEISLGSVHDYGLCIAEDDGEVDLAFPCLDANEPCSKFGFTCLGLIDLKSKVNFDRITSSIPDCSVLSGAFHVFPKASDSGQSHHNASRHNTGGSSTSEAVRSAIKAVNEGIYQIKGYYCQAIIIVFPLLTKPFINCLHNKLLFITEKRAGGVNLDKIQSHIIATEAPQCKAYKVHLLRKVRTNTLVQLVISLDRIEVEPLVTHKHAFWVRKV